MCNRVKLVLLFIILFQPYLLRAENLPTVKVNLIVFSHITKQTLKSETWPSQLILPAITHSIRLLPANSVLPQNIDTETFFNQYQLLDPNQVGLTTTIERLTSHGNQIILNIAWKQPASDKPDQWIHVFGGQAYDASGQHIAMKQLDTNSLSPLSNAVFWEINGLIKIDYSKVFNVATDLYLTLPQPLDNLNVQQYGLIPLITYTLKGQENLALNQFGYFDHPLFGALIYIIPN